MVPVSYTHLNGGKQMTINEKKQYLLQLKSIENQIKEADEKRVEAIAALNSTARCV